MKEIIKNLSILLHRWRGLFYIAITVLVAVGFDFRTPKAQFEELRAVDARLRRDLDEHLEDAAESTRRTNIRVDSVHSAIRALMIGECLDRPARETSLMGLRCDNLLNTGARP